MSDVASLGIKISTTDHEPHHTGKRRGGDRRSAKAKALQAANRPSLVTEISERRQRLDQTFYHHLRKLRRQHGDQAVDRALATLQQQRDAVAVTKQERDPQHFRRDRLARI